MSISFSTFIPSTETVSKITLSGSATTSSDSYTTSVGNYLWQEGVEHGFGTPVASYTYAPVYPVSETDAPKPTLIKTIGRKTFVTWEDGETTKVTCEPGATPDPFSAFCIAFAKKLMGSTSAILEAIDTADEKQQRKREHEKNRKEHEKKIKAEKERFDRDVEKKRYEMAVQREAEKRLKKK